MSEFSRLKRPKKGETEEDILEQMKKFESDKSSIQQGNLRIMSKPKEEEKKTSKFSADRQLKRQHQEQEQSEAKGSLNFLLKSVVEEKVPDFSNSSSFEPRTGNAFPEVLKCDGQLVETDGGATSNKKLSIFAQQMKKQGLTHNETKKGNFACRTSERYHRNFGQESLLLRNSKVLKASECASIHDGNVNILNSKTEEQIKQDRETLLSMLDPSIVSFLRKKKVETKPTEEQPVEQMVIEHPTNSQDLKETKNQTHEVKVEEKMEVDQPNIASASKPIDLDELKLAELTKFTHMENVEAEKLEWMKDVKSEADPKETPTQFNARFDFSGNLLPYDSADISVKDGLHHHGDEPERPGYTLDELLTLARSTFPQQKALAFSTLAKIIENFKKGKFDNCFNNETHLLNELIRADLVTLLRTGLDENNSSVILDASLSCLSDLVDNEIEEIGLDTQFFCSVYPGYVQPSLQVKISSDEEFKKEAPELKDIQIVSADLVLGLIRMDVLDRLAYIIETIKPPSQTTIVNIFRLLIRLSRHSLGSASKIVQHKSLLSAVGRYFLPLTSALATNTQQIYETPVHHALKFFRILMSWSRSFAIEILDKFQLGKKILCYISIEPSQTPSLPLQEVLRLTIEACRVWVICLRYGLETERFLEFFPIIMGHLQFLNSKVSMIEVKPGTKFNYHHATAILEVISAAICSIPHKLEVYATVDRRLVQTKLLEWSHFNGRMGILDLVDLNLRKWIQEVKSTTDEFQPFCVGLLASALSLFGTYIERYQNSDSYEPVGFLEKLEDLFPYVSDNIFKSQLLHNKLRLILEHSILGSDQLLEGRRRDPENLPSLGSISYSGDVLAGLKESSPFNFLNSLLYFVRAAIRAHTSLDPAGIIQCLRNESLVAYLNQVVRVGFKRSTSNWFARQEIQFLRLIIEINHQVKALDSRLMWKLSGIVLAHFQIGDEFFIQKTMRDILFNADYLDKTDEVIWKLSNTQISKDTAMLPSIEEAMPQMFKIYVNLTLPDDYALDKSIKINNKLCYSIASLTLASNGETCLPADWQYLPLLTVLNRRMQPQSSGGVTDLAKSDDSEISAVQLCLIWVYVMTISFKVEHKLSSASACIRLSRLATVFLATPDLFLDPFIHRLTEMSCTDILSECGCPKFDDSIPGIESFADFYQQLVEQFQAVSYGDSLFSLFLILPMTNVNKWKYRSILWNDYPEALRHITLKLEDLPKALGLSSFIERTGDTNMDLVRAYLKSLVTNMVLPHRNPLLFDIAISNLQKVCRDDDKFAQEAKGQLKSLKRDDLLSKII